MTQPAPGSYDIAMKVACGRKTIIEIGVGSGWSHHLNTETADLYLPYGNHPSDYEWPVSGCVINVYRDGDLEEDYGRRLLICLLASMATEVNWYANNRLVGTYFINDLEKLIDAGRRREAQRLPGKVGSESPQNQLSQEGLAEQDAA